MGYFILILAVVVFVVLSLALWRVFKKVLKVVILLAVVLVILLAVGGFLMIKDIKDFGKSFGTEDKLFLVQESGKMLSGTVLGSLEMGEDDLDALVSLDEAQLMTMQNLYREKRYEDMLGNNYKIFIIPLDYFDVLDDSIEVGEDMELKKEFMIEMMRSDDPRELYADKMIESMGLSRDHQMRKVLIEGFGTKEGFKSRIFVFMLASATEKEGVSFLFKGLSGGSIEAYPETAVFKAIKIFPGLAGRFVERPKKGSE